MQKNNIILSGCRKDLKRHMGKAYDCFRDNIIHVPTGFCDKFPANTKLAISLCHFNDKQINFFINARKQNVPSLLLADGILEWRNTWQHPGYPPEVFYQPVLADKMACLGKAQARVIEFWGNKGKCEIVGAPRFDKLSGLKKNIEALGKEVNVLILTARTPGFTEEQLNLTRQSLLDLSDFFQKTKSLNGVTLSPTWRLTAGLSEELKLTGKVSDPKNELTSEMLQHDIVITTSSTVQLESMLLGLPTVLLDYHNCPHYVPSAWTISCQNHINSILADIISLPQEKMKHQQYILHDNLKCNGDSGDRLIHLIEMMLSDPEKALKGPVLKAETRVIKKDLNDNGSKSSSVNNEHKVNEIIERILKSHKNIILYGMGKHTQKFYPTFQKYKESIKAIIDDHPEKGSIQNLWPVYQTEKIVSLQANCIIISSDAFQDLMFNKLKSMNLTPEPVIIKLYN